MFALNHKLGVELTEKVSELAALRQTALKQPPEQPIIPSFMKVMEAEQHLSENVDTLLQNNNSSPNFIVKKNAMKRSLDNYNLIV